MAALSHNSIIRNIINYYDTSINELENIQKLQKTSEPSTLFIRIQQITDKCIQMVQEGGSLSDSTSIQIKNLIEREVFKIKTWSTNPYSPLKVTSLQIALDQASLFITKEFPFANSYRSIPVPEIPLPVTAVVGPAVSLASAMPSHHQPLITPFQAAFNRLIDKLEILNKSPMLEIYSKNLERTKDLDVECAKLLNLIEELERHIPLVTSTKELGLEKLTKELKKISLNYICGVELPVQVVKNIYNGLKNQLGHINSSNASLPIAIALPVSELTVPRPVFSSAVPMPMPTSVPTTQTSQVQPQRSMEREIVLILQNDMPRYIESLDEPTLTTLNKLSADIEQMATQVYNRIQTLGPPIKNEGITRKPLSLAPHPKETSGEKSVRKSLAILDHLEKLSRDNVLPINNAIFKHNLLAIQKAALICRSKVHEKLMSLRNRKTEPSAIALPASAVMPPVPVKTATKTSSSTASTAAVAESHERAVIASLDVISAYIMQSIDRTELVQMYDILLGIQRELPKLIAYIDRIPKDRSTKQERISLRPMPSKSALIAMSTIDRLFYVKRYLEELENFKLRSGEELTVLLKDLNLMSETVRATLIAIEGRLKHTQVEVVSEAASETNNKRDSVTTEENDELIAFQKRLSPLVIT